MLFLCQILGIAVIVYMFCNYDKYMQVISKRQEREKKIPNWIRWPFLIFMTLFIVYVITGTYIISKDCPQETTCSFKPFSSTLFWIF